MLVYNGDLQLDPQPEENTITRKSDQNSPWEQKNPPLRMPKKKLMANRAFALVLLVGINACTYLAVRALVTS